MCSLLFACMLNDFIVSRHFPGRKISDIKQGIYLGKLIICNIYTCSKKSIYNMSKTLHSGAGCKQLRSQAPKSQLSLSMVLKTSDERALPVTICELEAYVQIDHILSQ